MADSANQTRYGSLNQYRSKEAYLADLRSWIDAKRYYSPGELSSDGYGPLERWYGKTTLDEYANRPGLHIGRGGLGRKKWKKEKDDDRQRWSAVDHTVTKIIDSEEQQKRERHRRRSSISNFWRRERA